MYMMVHWFVTLVFSFFPSADTVLLSEKKDAASPTSMKTDETSKTQHSELETSVAEFLNKSEVNIFDKQIFLI